MFGAAKGKSKTAKQTLLQLSFIPFVHRFLDLNSAPCLYSIAYVTPRKKSRKNLTFIQESIRSVWYIMYRVCSCFHKTWMEFRLSSLELHSPFFFWFFCLYKKRVQFQVVFLSIIKLAERHVILLELLSLAVCAGIMESLENFWVWCGKGTYFAVYLHHFVRSI